MRPSKEHDTLSDQHDRASVAALHSKDIASMLTPAEAAAILHVEPRTLEGWRQQHIGPRFFRYSGRCVRYHLEDLKGWLDTVAIETLAYEKRSHNR